MLSSQPASVRQRKKAATRARIYRAALGLFRRKGFSSTTVEEIAEAAEVSKGTFFNYYPAKEALLLAQVERMALEAVADLQTLPPDPQLPARQRLCQVQRRLGRRPRPTVSKHAWRCSSS